MADYFTNVLLTTPVTQDVRDQATAIISRAQQTMPWVGGLVGQAGLLFNQGRWPMPMNAADVTSDPAQQQQWKTFADAFSPMTKAVLKGAMADAKAEGVKLAADVAFWNTVARVDTAVATLGVSEAEGLWNDLKAKLNQLRDDRNATAVSLNAVRAAVNSPTAGPEVVAAKAQLAALDASQAQITAGAQQALGPLANIAQVKTEAGLGVLPVWLIAAGVSAAILTAAIAAIAIWCDKQAEVKEQAAQLAMDTLSKKDDYFKQLYADKKITFEQLQTALKNDAQEVSKVAAANNEAGFGANLGKYLGIGLGVAAIGAAIYFIAKGRKSAPAVATNPRRRRRI